MFNQAVGNTEFHFIAKSFGSPVLKVSKAECWFTVVDWFPHWTSLIDTWLRCWSILGWETLDQQSVSSQPVSTDSHALIKINKLLTNCLLTCWWSVDGVSIQYWLRVSVDIWPRMPYIDMIQIFRLLLTYRWKPVLNNFDYLLSCVRCKVQQFWFTLWFKKYKLL